MCVPSSARRTCASGSGVPLPPVMCRASLYALWALAIVWRNAPPPSAATSSSRWFAVISARRFWDSVHSSLKSSVRNWRGRA